MLSRTATYKISFFTFIILAILLSSCMNGDKVVNYNTTELEGIWLKQCYYVPSASRYLVETVEFQENNSLIKHQFYSDTDCSMPTLEFHAKGTFIIQESVILSDGQTVTQYRIEYQSATFTPKSESQTTSFNTNVYCNFDTWELDIASDVLDCENVNFTKIIYDIYKLDNNNLYFGKNS